MTITMQAGETTPVSPFVLTPLHAGPLKRDSGTQTGALAPERVEYVDAGNGYHVGTGTWTVVRGTGQYANVDGGGRSGNVWLDRRPWSSRDEGLASSLFVSALDENGRRALARRPAVLQ